MLILDKKKAYGTISPPCIPPGHQFDRPAHYQQDERFFDGEGIEIIPGEPKPKKPPKPVSPRKADVAPNGSATAPTDADSIMSPFELLQRHNQLPLNKLRQRAEVILGSLNLPCPERRADILEALLNAIETHPRSHE
jgi:hypothetical protein